MTTISIIIAVLNLVLILGWYLINKSENKPLEPVILALVVLVIILLMT